MEITFDGHPVRIATGGRSHDGDAPGVVLIHGAGMDRTTWQMQSRWLAHHGFRVAALDLPGHGLSGGEPLDSIEEMGRWTAGVIQQLDLAPAHIVGFSTGTFVALEAAIHDPSCGQSLVLVGTSGAMPVHPELLSSSYDDIPRASRLMTSWGVGIRAQRGGHRSPGTWLIGASTALLDRSPHNALGKDMEACNVYSNAVNAASSLTIPVTFVLGEEDKMTPIRTSGDLVNAVADHTVIRLDSTGHFMPTENPIEVRDAIAQGIGWDGSR